MPGDPLQVQEAGGEPLRQHAFEHSVHFPDVRPLHQLEGLRLQQIGPQLHQEAHAAVQLADVMEEAAIPRHERVAQPVLRLQQHGRLARLLAQLQHPGALLGHLAVVHAEALSQAAEQLGALGRLGQAAVEAHEVGALALGGRRRLLAQLVGRRRGHGSPQQLGPSRAKMVGRNSAIAAGVCGALFIGYCIYFDRKRRSDPNFKNRLRERRKKQKLAKERAGLSKLPDLKDAEAVQKFFLEEIQLGEELLAQGDYEKGVDHLTNAIAVCGQPQQLLQVLQQTLPPPVFQMLLTKLPTISQRIVSAQSLAEDDVE